jgi:hypothetical protein
MKNAEDMTAEERDAVLMAADILQLSLAETISQRQAAVETLCPDKQIAASVLVTSLTLMLGVTLAYYSRDRAHYLDGIERTLKVLRLSYPAMKQRGSELFE